MKIIFLVFLGILALNAVVILMITGILLIDHFKSRRRRGKQEAAFDDAHPNVP